MQKNNTILGILLFPMVLFFGCGFGEDVYDQQKKQLYEYALKLSDKTLIIDSIFYPVLNRIQYPNANSSDLLLSQNFETRFEFYSGNLSGYFVVKPKYNLVLEDNETNYYRREYQGLEVVETNVLKYNLKTDFLNGSNSYETVVKETLTIE